MKSPLKVIGLLFVLVIALGCKDKKQYHTTLTQKTENALEIHKITVKEIIEAGTYDYLQVEEDDKTYWMAIPNYNIEVGKSYYYKTAMVMKDFVSEQLNKTFDEIIFAEGVFASLTELNEAQTESLEGHMGHGTKKDQITINDVKLTPIKDAVTLEQLFTNTKVFENKTITVYGVVIKVNNDIMDKNWIHIMDGTKANNRGDLTITTNDIAKVGDTLKFNGKLLLNKDFGHGYKYEVLLENGHIVK